MKNLIVNLASLLLLFIGIISCNNEDEIHYSCDKKVDIWVKDNLKNVQNQSRSEWKNNLEELKIPIFRTFSENRKQQFWIDKINEVILAKQWAPQELNHIRLLLDTIISNRDWFADGGIQNQSDEVYLSYQEFFYNWKTVAEVELNWSAAIILSIAATGNSLMFDNEGNIIPNWMSTKTKGLSGGDCQCHDGNVVFTTCSCGSGKCEDSVHGCGAVWVESCNGICEPM